MSYLEKFQAIKKEKNLTNVEIAEISKVPLATVTRVFNGQTPNPSFETISQIALALGVSLDDISGLSTPYTKTTANTPIEKTLDAYQELLREKDNHIKELKEEKEQIRKDKNKLLIFILGFIFFILLLLSVDILNGNFGYFRY